MMPRHSSLVFMRAVRTFYIIVSQYRTRIFVMLNLNDREPNVSVENRE